MSNLSNPPESAEISASDESESVPFGTDVQPQDARPPASVVSGSHEYDDDDFVFEEFPLFPNSEPRTASPRLRPLNPSFVPPDSVPFLPPLGGKARAKSPRNPTEDPQAIDLLNECRAAAGVAKEANTAGTKCVEAALEKAMTLHHYLRSRPAVAENLLKQNGIRVTKTTSHNEFTPTVKLVFGIEERATISRYAKVLRFVAENRESGEDFVAVVDRGGGLVRCAQADAAQHKGTAKERQAARRSARLEMLRAQGISLKLASVNRLIQSRYTVLLIEHDDESGASSIIGIRDEEDEVSLSRFEPIKRS